MMMAGVLFVHVRIPFGHMNDYLKLVSVIRKK